MQTKTTVLSTALLLALTVPSLADRSSSSVDKAQAVDEVKPADDAKAADDAQVVHDKQAVDDAQAVQEATAGFYESLNALFTGDVSPMQQVWSHADDVTYMGPMGGFQVGWDQVWAVWEEQAALKLGGKVEPSEMHVTVGQDLAIVNCYELGNNVDAQGRPLNVSIRATNLFRKENGEWKMIGHHTDLLPYLEKQPRTSQAE